MRASTKMDAYHPTPLHYPAMSRAATRVPDGLCVDSMAAAVDAVNAALHRFHLAARVYYVPGGDGHIMQADITPT